LKEKEKNLRRQECPASVSRTTRENEICSQ